MKTLIEVQNGTWGRVKNFGTVKNFTLKAAVDYLLDHALTKHGIPNTNIGLSDRLEKEGD
jgi:hypothetical protein